MSTHTGPLTTDKALVPGGTALPWSAVTPALQAADLYWWSTARPDGAPHTRPVLAIWLDDTLCIAASPASRKGRNVLTNDRCSVAVRHEDLDIVVEGRAARLRQLDVLDRAAQIYAEKYGWPVEVRDEALWGDGAPTAGPPPFHLYRLTPEAAYAFGTSDALSDRATRWQF